METSRHQYHDNNTLKASSMKVITASKYKSIKVSLYQTIKTTNNMTTIKSETIKIRVDSQTLSEIQSRAADNQWKSERIRALRHTPIQ